MLIHKSSTRFLFLIALTIIAFYLLPYFIFREKSHLLIHDNLDANLVLYNFIAKSDYLFSSNETLIQFSMGGLPREIFPSEFNFTILWFRLFDPLGAYIFERVLIAMVGFIGAYLLLERHIIPDNRYSIIQVGVALTFGLLPFWPFGGLSVAGLPLLLYAFLNLRLGDKRFLNWLIILFYPFYAYLYLTGVFIALLIFIIILYDGIVHKHVNRGMIFGLVVLGLTFIFTHYRLFYGLLSETGYISHRTEFVFATNNLSQVLKDIMEIFLLGQYHAHSLHGLVILPTVVFGAFLGWKYKQSHRVYTTTIAFIIATSAFYGLWKWKEVSALVEALTKVIPIDLGRFHFLHPLLWSILFAVSLCLIQRYSRRGQRLILALIVCQLIHVFSFHELWANQDTPTYEAFFAQQQFSDIKTFIGRPVHDYSVVSIGIHPSIAQFNGFYTLDGYLSDYPLSYKHQFREIITPELARDETIRRYFDDWGSRAYIFTNELGLSVISPKNNTFVLQDLDLNREALWRLGARYILSAVQINTDNNPDYHLMQIFQDDTSAWDIYLYSIAKPEGISAIP